METIANDIADIKTNLGEISDTIKKIVGLNDENKSIIEEVEGIDDELVPLNKELDRIKFNIEKLKEYTATKLELEKEFGNVSIVKDALSPTKGIPLLFIDIYLQQTKGIANRLLDIAFKGKFFIDGFELNDKDFFIRAKKEDGQLVDDIGETSQGEKSLSSLSLSMALIQQSLRKYNILLLDELDSELDEDNRRAFVEMLYTQFDILGIEQAYLISHNREFDTQAVDLILMPNHGIDLTDKEYMKDKNVLYIA
jgi:chromosome segregation ATPase